MQTKKLINDPDRVVDDMLEGMLLAPPGHLRAVPGHRGPWPERFGDRGVAPGAPKVL